MAFLPLRFGLVGAAVLVAVGCAPIKPAGKSPLAPARMSADSVALDIFFVRIPYGLEEANGPLWNEIDEQHFPADVRRRLAQNGFRIGLVGDGLPSRLCHLLELKDKPRPAVDANETVLTDLESEPRVTRRHLQLRANQRSEIIASEIYDQLPVLTCESGDVCGRSYPKAQGLLTVKSHPEPDGRVRLELTPELQYGEMRQRYVGGYGALRLEAGRSCRTFDNLAVHATLAPGNMIVVSCLPDRVGSLGHHFFTHPVSGRLEQKLLIVRLSQTQHDDLLHAQEPQPLDLKADLHEAGPLERAPAAGAKAKKK